MNNTLLVKELLKITKELRKDVDILGLKIEELNTKTVRFEITEEMLGDVIHSLGEPDFIDENHIDGDHWKHLTEEIIKRI